MSVDRDEARRIADLARLELADEELERLTDDLSGILEHVDALRTLDLDEMSDLSPHIEGALRSTRSEEIDEPDRMSVTPEAFAPDMREGFFAAPPLPGLGADS